MTTRLNNHSFFRWPETGRMRVWGINGGLQNTCAASDGFIDNKIDRSDAVFKLLRLWRAGTHMAGNDQWFKQVA